MARKSKYTSTIVLAVLVLVAAGLTVWSRKQVPDADREGRRDKLLPALRRDNVTRVEVTGPGGRFVLTKESGQWFVTVGTRRYPGDDTEIEGALSEADWVTPSRRLGALDAASRTRFGLGSPRSRVQMFEGRTQTLAFTVGGVVEGEESAYVETGGAGFVAPKSFADAFVRRGSDLRDRTLAALEPARLARLEVDGEGGRRVLERRAGVWRLTTPAEGRASRQRVDTLLNALRDLRATRYIADEADAAALASAGLATPRITLRATRDRGGPTLEWRFGGPCPDHDDEVTVARGDDGFIACIGRAALEPVTRTVDELRDVKLLWARADEVERIVVHAPAGEYTVERNRDGWRMRGATGEADGDAVDAWLNTLGGLSAETRLDAGTAAAHGLAAPIATWIDVFRTGTDGSERINVGTADADRMYASRDDEGVVLGLDPTAAETLRVDPVRFRARRLVRDLSGDMVALLTETPAFHDEATRVEGTWRLASPADTLADPVVVHAAADRLATLDAERWVSSAPLPAHGLATPQLHLVARFEGEGAAPDGDAGHDGGRPRVREYTLNVGAASPDGNYYATLGGREGVFVLAHAALDELRQPHVDRNVLESDRATVERLELTRPSAAGRPETLVLRRDGATWRTAAGAAADRTRVTELLGRLSLVRAPRVFGYGPPPADAALGRVVLTVTLPALPGPDAGAPRPSRAVRLVLGAAFGTGSDAGVYARRDGLDATLSVSQELLDALIAFQP